MKSFDSFRSVIATVFRNVINAQKVTYELFFIQKFPVVTTFKQITSSKLLDYDIFLIIYHFDISTNIKTIFLRRFCLYR